MIVLGRMRQVNCPKNEFYKFLGYIANHPNDVKLVFEHNALSGAWGNEGRIQFTSDTARVVFGDYFKFTKGVGRTLYRLNCNSLLDMMVGYGFTLGSIQNYASIRAEIPSDQLVSFDEGTAL